MVDVALEPRSVLAANVAQSKNQKSHDLANQMSLFDPFANSEELLLKTAYGDNTIGQPLLGRADNI